MTQFFKLIGFLFSLIAQLFPTHKEIPVLTACGLVWTVILSLSAGNVNSCSLEEKDDIMDSTNIEEEMISEFGNTKGSVGFPRSFSDSRTKKKGYVETREEKEPSMISAKPAGKKQV